MKRYNRVALLFPLMVVAMAACNAGSPLAPATPTVLPAATPIPPTVTPVPPAATTASGTASNLTAADTAAILAAVQKTAAAGSYRVEMEMKGSGDLGLSGQDNKPMDDVSFFSVSGEFKGMDAHYTLKGFLSALVGVDPNKGIEAITAGGKQYVRGPISMIGANEDRWYVLEADQIQAIKPPMQAADLLAGLSSSNVDLSVLRMAGSETVDGQTCTAYTGDRDMTIKAFEAMSTASLPGVEALTQVKDASVRFSVCDDGYLRQAQMKVQTAGKDNPDQLATFMVNMRVFDFEAPMNVTAPADAAPLKVSP